MTSLNVDPNEEFGEKEQAAAVAVPEEKPKDKKGVEKVARLPPAPMQATDRGLLIGSTLEEQYRLAQYYSASGLMPRGLNTPEKVLVALQLCRELNLPPMMSIGRIMVVNGTPAVFGDLPVALAYRSGKMERYEESFEDKDGEPFAATCTVKRVGMEPITRRFTIEDAKRAGLFKNEIWNKYTRRMLQCRSRAWALKDSMADVLMGLSILEYDFNATVDQSGNLVGDARETKDVASELNQRYLESDGGTA